MKMDIKINIVDLTGRIVMQKKIPTSINKENIRIGIRGFNLAIM
ncbi:MAG TPA: hypothetical protein VHO70_13020 [Chitinispirillaceae bacterium]|nr:hypothetical protein [Chitinispirillaceae bacterium]